MAYRPGKKKRNEKSEVDAIAIDDASDVNDSQTSEVDSSADANSKSSTGAKKDRRTPVYVESGAKTLLKKAFVTLATAILTLVLMFGVLIFMISFGIGIVDASATAVGIDDYVLRITFTSAVTGGLSAGVIVVAPKFFALLRDTMLNVGKKKNSVK